MSTQYCLRVIRAEGLQWKRRIHRRLSKLYVEVKLGNDTRTTRTIEKSTSPVWNEPLIFSSSDESAIFSLRVMHDSSWTSNPCVGYFAITLVDLLRNCVFEEAKFDLLLPSEMGSTTPVGSIFLHLQAIDPTEGAAIMIKEAGEGIEQCGIMRTAGAADVMTSIDNGASQLSNDSDLYQAIGQLVSRLGAFMEVIDVVSEIHPFLTVAWKLTSCLVTAITNVFRTDKRVVDLVRAMEGAFDFVREAQSLPDKIASLQQSIVGLLKQTIECCLFIRQYTSRGFAERMLDSSSRQKVDEFEQSLNNFKKEIDSGVNLHTAIVSVRASHKIDELVLRQRLNPSETNAFDRPVCLDGTRVAIKEEIMEWIFSETKQNILWLHGVAGSGKSTVSTTIAEHVRDMSRLGAYLFFERGKSEPSSVIRTIAYKLSLFDSSICSGILSEIDHDKDIVAASAVKQFNKLLLQPLKSASSSVPGPIVIVLDALDECGTAESRRGLMQLLRNEFSKLPNIFRFFVTSRREPDIDRALSSQSNFIAITELDYTSESSQRDVLSYLHSQMNEVVRAQVEVPESWPWDDNLALLGRAASGLFIWASTAVKLVSNSDNPFYTLNRLVSDSQLVSGYGLYKLYATVLHNSGIAWRERRSRERFSTVLALVLVSKVPLSTKAIDGLLGYPPEETSLLALSRLRCLLSYSAGQPVGLFHASFSDYLMSPDRAKDPWYIDFTAQKCFIAIRCFSIIEDMLHFNMCDLETSFVSNDAVPGLEDRIKRNIPSHLEYACMHWSQHVCDAPYSPDLLEKLSDFAYRRLLFWFEVLSLKKAFRRLASSALLDSATWIAPHNSEMSSFLKDASNLASTFAFCIMQSTPHIYISMLPLSKDDSEVSAHYSQQMCSTVGVKRRGSQRPRMWLKVLEGHSGWVMSVAISPDGTRIASASSDKTIRVWDFDSGEEVLLPLTGHSDGVLSVSFSPDGQRLVSGSADSTLIIWDIQDGSIVLGPLKRHTNAICSVSYSPGGKRIASGSHDQTVIVWDAASGEVITGPLEGHTDSVQSVAFSPDGTRVASGSSDKTVRIWDVDSGEPVLEPFEGHTNAVMSVAFSPDGKHVASGSWDETITIWDVESGGVVSELSGGHTLDITSVAYFPCGTRIVSGSSDKTIVVWDVASGKILSGPLEGHADVIMSVAYTPDRKHVVSGSSDETVRIWGSAPGGVDSRLFTGHRGAVISVAFSSDGSRVASASDDKTIIIWDSRTGDIIAGPLEGHANQVTSIAFSSDNSRLVSGSADHTIRIWNTENGEVIADPLEGHTAAVLCIALSPDGTNIVSGSADETIRVWDLASGELLAGPLLGHSDAVSSIAFSPNGERLASGSYDKTIRIWDTASWETISGPLTGHTDSVYSVCFSPDGTRIVSGSRDETIIVWDVETGQIVAGPFIGHSDSVTSAIFSLDGKHVISGSYDRTIRVWNVITGESIYKVEDHVSDVMTLALSPDGKRLASGSVDNTVRVWDVSAITQQHSERHSDSISVASSVESEDLSDWILGDNGWIFNRGDRHHLLFWIPPDLRPTLLRPLNTAILSEFSTQLDLSGAALGKRWTNCYTRL